MIEVEYKARVRSMDAVYNYLLKSGFKASKIDYKDIYYEHPCRDFKKMDEELRLRVDRGEEHFIYLTYKGPSLTPDRSARLEIETKFIGSEEDIEKINSIFNALGFVPKIWKRKKGYSLRKDDLEITLVEVSGGKKEKSVNLGYFVEVEKKIDDEKQREDVEKEIISFIRKIPGVGRIETKYYTEMIEAALGHDF